MVDDMDVAGDIIQSLGLFLNLEVLQVVADFPNDMEEINQVIEKVRSSSNCLHCRSLGFENKRFITTGYRYSKRSTTAVGRHGGQFIHYTELYYQSRGFQAYGGHVSSVALFHFR